MIHKLSFKPEFTLYSNDSGKAQNYITVIRHRVECHKCLNKYLKAFQNTVQNLNQALHTTILNEAKKLLLGSAGENNAQRFFIPV